jgi:hypothetical protein
MVDLLLQAPTLAWQAHRPFDTGEVITLRVSSRPGGVWPRVAREAIVAGGGAPSVERQPHGP